MPLVAYEIARNFGVSNLLWLVSQPECWDTNEGLFRIRALMLEKLVEDPYADNDKALVFCGFNDGPFDEAIYSRRHLMRTPGLTKGNRSVSALSPVKESAETGLRCMISSEKLFMNIYNGYVYEDFCGFLINRLFVEEGEDEDKTVLVDWRVSPRYPKKRNHCREVANRALVVET